MDCVTYLSHIVATLAMLLTVMSTQEIQETLEFCHMQQVNISCRHDEVILVKQARHGRMKFGRCVKEDLGYLGCAVDVTKYLDGRCSGRQACQFPLPDPVLYKKRSCPQDTTPYLEVTYKCLKVTDSRRGTCKIGQPVVVSRQHGFLSAMLTEKYGVGTKQCPWRITVEPGQHINMTLYNFNRGEPITKKGDAVTWPSDTCFEYAVLKDGDSSVTLTLCNRPERTIPIYRSQSSNITLVVVANTNVLQLLGLFLIEYQAIGCPDIAIPANGWVRRTSSHAAVLGCNRTGEVWYVACRGTKWSGNVGNCSTDGSTSGSLFGTKGGFPYGILVVVAIGVALGVFFGGLLLSLASLYMRQRRHERPYATVDQQFQMTVDKTCDDMSLARMDKLHCAAHEQGTLLSGAELHPTPCRAAEEHFPADVRRPYYPGREMSRSGRASRGHIYECPQFT